MRKGSITQPSNRPWRCTPPGLSDGRNLVYVGCAALQDDFTI